MTEPEPVPAHDAIAEAISAALTRTAADEPSAPIEWSTVASRARRIVRIRRVVAAGICATVVLGATGVAMAARSGSAPSDLSVVAPPTTENAATTTTATSTLPPIVSPGPSTTTTSSSTTPSKSTTTTAPSPPDTAVHPQPAGAGDFAGQIDHWGDSCGPCTPGDSKNVQLTITNTTDHAIDLSPTASVRVALICATGMTADGLLGMHLPADGTDWLVDIAVDGSGHAIGSPDVLAPGEQATSMEIGYAIDGTGTLTCEGALVTSSDGTWRAESLAVTARLTTVPVYSVAVVASPPTSGPAPTTTAGS